MLKIELSGSPDQVLKAQYVLELLFEGVSPQKKRRTRRTMRLALVADQLPSNEALLGLVKMAEAKQIV